ncbi:RNA polymerase sigma-70 factor [Spirosoma arcticum]
MQPTEQDAIEAIRQGDERAYEIIFRQHYAPLCRYARQFLTDADEAEEEVQAMFLALWERRDGLFITTSLKGYLFRAVHNRCLNRIKHFAVRDEYQQHARYVAETTAESPMQRLLGDELSDRLRMAIQKLPEQCRLAFTLSRFEELRYGEIADQLGISPKTVENQIGKALRILRTELSDYLPLLLVINNVQWLMDNAQWLNSLTPYLLLVIIMHYSLCIVH